MSDREFSTIAERLAEFISKEIDPHSAASVWNDSQFNELALRLFRLQYARIEPYQRFCRNRVAGPHAIHSWKSIPAMPVAAWKAWDLTGIPAAERNTVFHSSGTTQHTPSRHFHCHKSLQLYELSVLNWFKCNFAAWITKPEQQMLILTPPASEAPQSSLVHMFDTIRKVFASSDSVFLGYVEGVTGGWCVNLEKARAALYDNVAASRPVALLGTAFNFVHLLDHLAEQGVRMQLPNSSWIMETGGYKGQSRAMSRAELHGLIESYLDIPREQIVSEYGMCELGSQAYDAVPQNPQTPSELTRRVFRFPPWARAQIISPETGHEVCDGESGLIRVFDLANVYSLMAIQTEDLGVRCRDGFELLGRSSQAEPRGCSLMSVSTP